MKKKGIAENFKILSLKEENKLSLEEKKAYYEKMKKFYQDLGLNKKMVKFRELIHPLLLFGVKKFKDLELVIFNEDRIPLDGTYIFAVNHSNANDFPVASRVVKQHFYILADFTMKKDFVVNMLNELNGVIYVDRKDKESRKQSKNEMIKLLSNNKSILLFPEGTWNLEPSTLLLPLNWGIIDIAKITDTPIIPIILEYRENKCFVNIGDKFVVDFNSKKEEEILKLTDTMATLKWEIYESFPITSRKNIDDNYFKQYVDSCLNGYKKFDLEYEMSTVIKNTDSKQFVFDYVTTNKKSK